MRESCLIIAGEKSGEDHTMTFFPKLKATTPNCDFYGVGGNRLESEGMELLYHLKDFSGIGISEILGKIPFYFRALDHIVDEVKKRGTKTAILVDFQGFNLKLAKKLKQMNVEVLYYVAPQAWVWKPWRAKVLEKSVNTLFTILPFEKEWFQKRGVSKVKGVVHPLMLEYSKPLDNIRQKDWNDFQKRSLRVLILPGSRRVEVQSLYSTFLASAKKLQEDGIEIELGVVKADSVAPEFFEQSVTLSKTWSSEEIVSAMDWADLCMAASGTVTLATGLFALPTVVCYKVSLFTQLLLKLFMTYKGPISLTNIILEKMVFPEFIQKQVNILNIVTELKKWIENKDYYNQTISELLQTKNKLTGDNFSVPEYMAKVISHAEER